MRPVRQNRDPLLLLLQCEPAVFACGPLLAVMLGSLRAVLAASRLAFQELAVDAAQAQAQAVA